MNLADALKQLDHENDAHWNQDGSIALSAISEIAGRKVKREELLETAPDLNRTTLAEISEPAAEPAPAEGPEPAEEPAPAAEPGEKTPREEQGPESVSTPRLESVDSPAPEGPAAREKRRDERLEARARKLEVDVDESLSPEELEAAIAIEAKAMRESKARLEAMQARLRQIKPSRADAADENYKARVAGNNARAERIFAEHAETERIQKAVEHALANPSAGTATAEATETAEE